MHTGRKIRIMLSELFNPWFNIATEDWIFSELEPDCHILYLWRNANTVIIGRHQNPWAECNIEAMEQDKVNLARRMSGGGAVFQDLGNMNFTFLSPRMEYDQEANFKIIIDALASFGIEAEYTGRNDIVVDGRKVSGSAFKHQGNRSFHHGTLLINSNMDKLANYLKPRPLKLEAKGIRSVRSRVANLVDFNPDITYEAICDAIIEKFSAYHGATAEREILDEGKLAKIPYILDVYNRLSDWNWRFGKTPEFSHHMETRFDWGILDAHVNVAKGAIADIEIFSDALNPELINALKETLRGCAYTSQAIAESLNSLLVEHKSWDREIADVIAWLSEPL